MINGVAAGGQYDEQQTSRQASRGTASMRCGDTRELTTQNPFQNELVDPKFYDSDLNDSAVLSPEMFLVVDYDYCIGPTEEKTRTKQCTNDSDELLGHYPTVLHRKGGLPNIPPLEDRLVTKALC